MNAQNTPMVPQPAPVKVFTGVSASRGFASGPVYLFHSAASEQVPEYAVNKAAIPAELNRLDSALALTQTQIQSLSSELSKRISGEEAAILDGHLMMVSDPQFIGDCKTLISKNFINAEAAVVKTVQKYAAIFNAMDDVYLKERVKDVNDLAKRIIRNLLGADTSQAFHIERPSIVVADEISPSETIGLPKAMILAFATDRGSLTSHATLLARALGIPAVVGLGTLSASVHTGDNILLDGTSGKVVLNPGKEERQAFDKMIARSRNFEASLEEGKRDPGSTADGQAVPFLANVAPNTPMADLPKVGAEGIGLYRTEYLWLSVNREPTEEEQEHAYTEAVRALSVGQTATIRVFDLGGDKMTANAVKESNPFLGNRSIRFLLRNPQVLRRQFRAILKASVHGRVQILYPMVATIEELRAANVELCSCQTELRQEGVEFDEHIRKGVMIEIPAAALIADALAQEVDFFSIGTNDLVQYTLAVDRSNETVCRLYQPTHPAVLHLIDMAVKAAHARKLPVTVCGEAASDPVLAALFVGMGVDELSMAPNLIPLVKKVIRQLDMPVLRQLSRNALGMSAEPASALYSYYRKGMIKSVPGLLYLK